MRGVDEIRVQVPVLVNVVIAGTYAPVDSIVGLRVEIQMLINLNREGGITRFVDLVRTLLQVTYLYVRT